MTSPEAKTKAVSIFKKYASVVSSGMIFAVGFYNKPCDCCGKTHTHYWYGRTWEEAFENAKEGE